QEGVDLDGLGELVELQLGGLGELLLDDLVAEIDALVTDVDTWTGDELLDLLLGLAAEGTLQEVGVPELRHPPAPSIPVRVRLLEALACRILRRLRRQRRKPRLNLAAGDDLVDDAVGLRL